MLRAILVLAAITAHVTAEYKAYRHPQEALQDARASLNASRVLSRELNTDWLAVAEAIDPVTILEQGVTPTGRNISEICARQVLNLLETLADDSKGNPWTISFLDSWGKPEAGILQGNLRWLGNYDECTSISANGAYEGKYCLTGQGLAAQAPAGAAPQIGIQIGVCVPSGCSQEDVVALVRSPIDLINRNMSSQINAMCQEVDKPYTTGAIAAIVVFTLFGILCLTGTAYDIYFKKIVSPEPSPSNKTDDVLPVANGHSHIDTEVLVPSVPVSKRREPEGVGEFLICFSLYTNGSKLLNTKQSAEMLSCLNGIRFVSMTWVILGHTLVFMLGAVSNLTLILSWEKRFTFQAVAYATVSVDSFFVLSGILSCYLFLKELNKTKKTVTKFLISVPIMYLHRYIRLTPAYGFMILYYTYLTIYMYSGPLKPTADVQDPNCVNNAWASLLYVNNLYDSSKQCAAWGWYLSNDFQFFLITPFIVYMIYRFPLIGNIINLVLVAASTASGAAVSVIDDLGVNLFTPRDPKNYSPLFQLYEMRDYYFNPGVRYQSYGIGLLFGFILYRLHGKTKIPLIVNLLCWAAAAAICLSVIYGPYDISKAGHIASKAESAMYNGFSRTAWSVGIGYVILACCLDCGGWVNSFLSWPAFVPLSRLTYCAYLVHPVVIMVRTYSSKSLIFFDDWSLVFFFVSYVVLAYGVAFIFSLVFEAPFMLIDKKYVTGLLSKKATK